MAKDNAPDRDRRGSRIEFPVMFPFSSRSRHGARLGDSGAGTQRPRGGIFFLRSEALRDPHEPRRVGRPAWFPEWFLSLRPVVPFCSLTCGFPLETARH